MCVIWNGKRSFLLLLVCNRKFLFTFAAVKLIIDIGNTVAKLVAFQGNEPVEEIRVSNETLDGVSEFASKFHFLQGVVGSVREISTEGKNVIQSLPFPVLEFTSVTPIPIHNRYRTPQTLGTDRLAAVIGASVLLPGKDLLVIDAGTCITYEVIDARGNYWGGNIAPGMQMRLKALHEYTARLPLVSSTGIVPGIGYDTETAIRSGILRGMKYEIEGYIRSMTAKFPHLQVFLTGGDEINFDTTIKNTIYTDKYLVPRGLNRILDYNYERK